MDVNTILDYVTQEVYVLIPVLYVLGYFIKRTPNIPDWTIPYILLIFGVGLSMAIMQSLVNGIIQGVLVTGGAVLVYQLIKQAKDH